MDQPLVPLRRAAELLDVSLRTARSMCAEGSLPGAVRVGGAWRVDLAVLQERIRAGGFTRTAPAAKA